MHKRQNVCGREKMKPIKIKIPKTKKPRLLKETKEERAERIKYASTMRTQVVPNRKYKTRAQQKQEDLRREDD